MPYYIAYIAEGITNVEYYKLANKDDVIDFLIGGHTMENWTGLHKSLKECKEEVRLLVGDGII